MRLNSIVIWGRILAIVNRDMVLVRLRILKQDDFNQIDHLISAVDSYVHKMHSEISEKCNDLLSSPELDESTLAFEKMMLSDDAYFYEKIKLLTHELAVVALYKRIEILTKRAVTTAFSSANASSLFRFKDLKSTLLSYGVDLTQVAHYSALDETRIINNCIKHSGTVNDELAAYSGWTLGQPLGDLAASYSRLEPLCLAYFNDLVDKLIDRHLSSPVH